MGDLNEIENNGDSTTDTDYDLNEITGETKNSKKKSSENGDEDELAVLGNTF